MPNEFITRNGLVSLGGITFPYRAVTTTYPVTANDSTVDCTSGTFNVTLPTAVGVAGKQYIIKNSGGGTITLNTTSSQTIDGDLTKTLAQYSSYFVESNGANWIIAVVGGGGSSGYTVVSITSTTYNAAQTTGSIVLLVDAATAGGNVTVNLPTAVGNTAQFTVKKIDSGSNTVIIDGNSTETIDGETTATIYMQYASLDLVNDNANWSVI